MPVWGWVLIPYSAGYWAWEGAAEEEMRAVQTLVRWKAKNKVRLRGIVIDPEPVPPGGAQPRSRCRRRCTPRRRTGFTAT